MGNFAKIDLQALFKSDTAGLETLTTQLVGESRLIHCDVVFGSPRSDCGGAGICKIVDINSRQHLLLKRNCRLAPALLTVGAGGNELTMTFLREFMCVHLLRHHFRMGILDVQDACPIPARVAAVLGLNGDQILPGRYAIEEGLRGFKISFSL